MNSIEASKAINEILVNKSNKSKCILIDGEWGIGKTYSIENLKVNNLKCISLFGKDDINKIEKDLILQIEFNINEKIKNTKSEMIFNGFKKIASNYNINLDLNSYLDNISIENLQRQDITICIDDIERKSKEISIEKLLGLAERISSKYNLILISNTAKLNDDEKKLFNEFKEKVVDIEIIIDELDDNQIRMILEEYFADKYNLIGESNVNKIINEFRSKDNLCNIRVLNKFIDLLNKVNEEISKIMNSEKFWLNSTLISSCYRVICKKYLNCSNKSADIDNQIEKIMNFDSYNIDFLKDFFDNKREVIKDAYTLMDAYRLNNNQLSLLIEKVISKINNLDLDYFTKQEDVISINEGLHNVIDEKNYTKIDKIDEKLLKIATKLYNPCVNEGIDTFIPKHINNFKDIHETTLKLKDSIECRNIELYEYELKENLEYNFKIKNYNEYRNILVKNLSYKDMFIKTDEFFIKQFEIILHRLEEEFSDSLWDCACGLVKSYGKSIIDKYINNNKDLSLLTKIRIKELNYI